MPQNTYNLDNVAALAGQAVSVDQVVGKYVASEEIAPGRAVELHTDGKLRLYRGGKLVGIAMYRSAKEPGAWAADDYVPVLREGQIWAAFSGSSVSDLGDVFVKYASSTTTHRGKVTDSMPSSTSDAEVYEAKGLKFFGSTSGDTSLALLEVDCAASANALAPIELTQSSNVYAPTSIRDGQIYELGTTAANSTVDLPTGVPNGTKLFFVADGTKNGHTLTFRDVSTNISAATTASKRVAAMAMRINGKWAVTLTVGP